MSSSVRRPSELAAVDGLVIPGGESSVIDKLSRAFGMQQPIRDAIAAGMPVYGTCAGLILLADRITDGIDGQQSFGGLDVTVQRNAFGSQVDSFETDLDVPGAGRAARCTPSSSARRSWSRVGTGSRRSRALDDGRIVAVRAGRPARARAFHPEVTGEHRFHQLLPRHRPAARSDPALTVRTMTTGSRSCAE